MKHILLYAPDVVGHPPVYCRVIADALAAEPCELVIAMGFTENNGLRGSPDIQPLLSRARVQVIGTTLFSRAGKPHLAAEELLGLQDHFNIDTTLFIEGDKSKREFIRIAAREAPPFRGRNLGIFAGTTEWYPGEDSYTGERRTLFGRTWRTTLGNIKRSLFNRRESAHFFYEKIIIRSRVLNEILVKDERLAKWRGPPTYWMPEISRALSDRESRDETAEFNGRRAEIESFLMSNHDREPILYFGDAAYYKGYDLFLEFAARAPSTCVIHTGRPYELKERSYFRYDVDALRAKLINERRLYETNAYVSSYRLKKFLFESIRLYITTHRLALSSSTVIQALECGKPVLVPDRGLLGYRVRNNNLGEVYNYEDVSDIWTKAEKLWRSDLCRFSLAAKSFWQHFSDQAVRKFFVERLLYTAD